ncbi:Urb2/Npa2 family-domain-containing protein [Mycena floridula]|nr:Urb2/Npa2 family-domain-containing protein [Mycena floridula]
MNSQNFVRALKSVSDPPANHDRPKIDLATEAWNDASFYVPRKEQVISEWLLSKLLKDSKGNNPDILDSRYWSLLADVLTARALNDNWLVPLLNQISIAPIVVSFFQNQPPSQPAPALEAVNRCLTVVWPLSVARFSADTLLQCFTAMINFLTKSDIRDDSLFRSVQAIVSSYRSSLEHSNIKKKIYQSFSESPLSDWLLCLTIKPTSKPVEDALQNIYMAGVDTLFSLDVLRSPDTDQDLIQSLSKIDPGVVLVTLPRLFSSFIQSVKKHRAAIFSQGSSIQSSESSLTAFHAMGMRFFASCAPLLENDRFPVETWTARTNLLALVHQENLFVYQSESVGVFGRTTELALSILASTDSQIHVASLSIDCISCLLKIDYQLVAPILPIVLPRFLLQHDSEHSVWACSDLIREYHAKTRTMNDYVEMLFSAVGSSEIGAFPQGSRRAYQLASSCALLHPDHLMRLSKALQLFLTPAHAVETVRHTLDTLNSCWDSLYAMLKTSDEVKSANPDTLAVAFSLSARLATVILSSLPSQSLTLAMREETSALLDEFQRSSLRKALSKLLKTITQTKDDEGWTSKAALAALLRLHHVLNLEDSLVNREPYYNDKLVKKLAEIYDNDQLPELNIEIVRMLLMYTAVGRLTDTPAVCDLILAHLEKQPMSSARQDLLRSLTDRWLPVLDAHASESQLEGLVKDIAFTPENADATNILASAEFWELPNIRLAFLAHVEKSTVILDSDTESEDFISLSESISLDEDKLRDLTSVYQTLLGVPTEYYPRHLKAKLIRRAFVVDILVSRGPPQLAESRTLDVIRSFCARLLGSVDLPTQSIYSFLEYLITNNETTSSEGPNTAIIKLVEVLLLPLLRAAETDTSPTEFSACCRKLRHLSFSRWSLRSECYARMVQLLFQFGSFNKFTEETRDNLRKLHDKLLRSLSSKLDEKVANSEVLKAWQHTLLLGRWLKLEDRNIRPLGRRLFSEIAKVGPEEVDSIRVITSLAITIEEFHAASESEKVSYLDTIVASYATILGIVDSRLAQMCSILSTEDYSYVTDIVLDLLADDLADSLERRRLIHICGVLLQDPPQNTLKVTQAFMTRCLARFASYSVETGSTRVEQEILQFIARRCSDRPAALRLVDLNSIWSILAKLLANSNCHDSETSVTVFRDIVTIISALVRLRRDLLVHTLPHLSMALRQLIMSTRAARPYLGAKQSSLVAKSFPKWVAVDQPLPASEGKILSRLLETLLMKSVARNHGSSADVRKAESLAKPFAKHAAYLLQAYLEAMNDPLCNLSLGVRQELLPGIYALCEMLNEHNRDAMMSSALDATGKAAMKSLWKEYEKQHYAGQG